jgi:hypothetical protein
MGSEAGRAISGSPVDVIALGRRAGYYMTGGTNSTLIGYQAGRDSRLGSNNIIIGTNISLSGVAANRINIGGVIFGSNTYGTTSGSPATGATATGMIGIGVDTPTARLTLPAATTTQASLRLITGSTAPTSPNDGDIWIQNGDLKVRLSGVSKTVQVDASTASTSSNVSFNTNSGSTYTLQLSDSNNTVIEMTSSTINTVTVPPSATTNFSTGVQISVVQNGTGQTSIVAGAGVTILSAGGALNLRAQYSFATLIKKSGNTWYLSGDISV